MTETRRPVLSIKRKPSTLTPPSALKTSPAGQGGKVPTRKPPGAAKPEPKPQKVTPPPPATLPRQERLARNLARRQRRGQEGVALLQQHFPALFSLTAPVPLKVGIFDDLLAYVSLPM